MNDLDLLEQSIRAAEGKPGSDRTRQERAIVLDLIARLRAAETLLASFVIDWEDGADFDHRQLRRFVRDARAILPPGVPPPEPPPVGTF